MEIVRIVLQVIVALGLINVWLMRRDRPTPYRGGKAKNMREEFATYGLPPWSLYLVGGLKIAIAIAFLAGIWVPALVQPAAILLALLMLGAFAMHMKVKDPMQRALPSVIMLVLAVLIAVL